MWIRFESPRPRWDRVPEDLLNPFWLGSTPPEENREPVSPDAIAWRMPLWQDEA